MKKLLAKTFVKAENENLLESYNLSFFRKKSSTSKREGAIAPVKVGDEFRLGVD